MERKIWLEEAIEEHVKNNPDRDSVDIVSHFKLRADITMSAIAVLEHEGRITRNHLYGTIYGYRALVNEKLRPKQKSSIYFFLCGGKNNYGKYT